MRVAVTTPEHYVSRIIEAFETVRKEKAELTESLQLSSFPLISTKINAEKIESEMASWQKKIDNADYIIFCSRRAIEGFYKYFHCRNTILIGIGKDRDMIRDFDSESKLLSLQEDSLMGIVKALEKEVDTTSNLVVLAPVVENLEEPDTVPSFLRELTRLNSNIEVLPIYRVSPDKYQINRLRNAIEENSIGEIIFTSGMEVNAFADNITLNASEPPCRYSCLGPYTAAQALKRGFNVRFVSSRFYSFRDFWSEYMKSL